MRRLTAVTTFRCTLFLATAIAPRVQAADRDQVVVVERHSELLGRREPLWLILPPGYDDPANARKHYPVIFLCQGKAGAIRHLYDQMAAEVLPPMIAVASDVGAGRRKPRGAGETAWSDLVEPSESWIIQEVIPHLNRSYPTITDRPGYVTIGQSKGGSGAIHLALKFPDVFASRCGRIRACEGAERGAAPTSASSSRDSRGAEISTVFLNGVHRNEWTLEPPNVAIEPEGGDVYQYTVSRPVEVLSFTWERQTESLTGGRTTLPGCRSRSSTAIATIEFWVTDQPDEDWGGQPPPSFDAKPLYVDTGEAELKRLKPPGST